MCDIFVIPSLTRKRLILLLIVMACIIISFILRILPWSQIDLSSLAITGDPDVWYNFRQIEVMVSDFPQYNWFDPMTAYPFGKNVDWGPLTPTIASLLCLLAGAAHQAEIIAISSWLPVIVGIAMIPVIFFLGRLIGGWKSGILAAVLIAFVSGEYFYRTMAGHVDHHSLEILFSTLFCLFYIWAIKRASESEVNLKNLQSLKALALPALFAGLSIALGMAVMPTLILFALIVAIYTTVHYSWNAFHRKRTDYLLILNSVVSVGGMAGLATVGIQTPYYNISTYSAAPYHAFILLFSWTLLLQILSMVTQNKPRLFIGLMGMSMAAVVGVVALVNLPLFLALTGSFSAFFAQSFTASPIEELKPWSLGQMWASFNIIIILGIIGLILFAYKFWKKQCPLYLFCLVWGIVLLIATIQHSRYEYYSAMIIVLSASFTLAALLSLDNSKRADKTDKKPVREKKEGKEKKKKEKGPKKKTGDGILSDLEGTGTSAVLACMVICCGVSIMSDYYIAVPMTKAELIPHQWTDVLIWMEGSTAYPGVSYLGPYDKGDQWEYPPESYGVLSWWDYGHWITFISKRIPVTNPFQDNIIPSTGYFFTDSEDTANKLADDLGIKFVITDWKMVESKFPAMVSWYSSTSGNPSVKGDYYYQVLRIGNDDGKGNQTLVRFHKSPYYQTMVSRLHNFDGSMTVPAKVVYVEYAIPESIKTPPRISAYEVLENEAADERLLLFESAPHEGRAAAILNTALNTPVKTVQALHHYRLIYEQSETNGAPSSDESESVKVFEYVKGAQLKGDGIIEVTVQTNIGRTFVYRQESQNGLFILPYSTTGSSYPVKTIGPYRQVPSGRTFEVSEQDVLEGKALS